MSQYDFGNIDPYVVDGIQLAGMLNQWRTALYSKHRGAAVPSYAVPGLDWISDAAGANAWQWEMYFGPTVGSRPIFDINSTNGYMALSTGMLAATTANPADASAAVATNAFVQAAIQAAISTAISALLPTGTLLDLPGIPAVIPAGWVRSMQGTIGSAASGATIRANADCENLYKHMWTLANTEAPVTGGRGPDADADWLANKPIGGLDFRGTVRATWDAQGGAGAGRLPQFPRVGVIGGASTHTLTTAELASHGHTARGYGLVGNNLANGTSRAVGTGDGVNSGYFQDVQVTVDANGGNGAHNNTQPTRTVTTLIKL